MNVDLVITQLRSAASFFGARVGGAARFEKAVSDQTWMALPAAYVVPLDDTAAPNSSMNGLQQIVTERVGVIVVLDNSVDRRGQSTAEQLMPARAAVFAAILNWQPDGPETREARGLYYAGGQLLDMDRARFFYQFDFALDATITDLDGWQPAGVPLVEVALDIDFTDGRHLLGSAPYDLAIAVAIPQPLQTEAGGVLTTEQGTGLLSDNPPAPFAP